ncbi:chromatin assembly factor 1 subunit A [Plodia interpunctella]|uniref:chromatin assembly factor 1 subunit A n=1 Tax=Plodia interpunctella TaxID=58824 RepID=UPI002368E38D|nr:chromatin assembly factor 1 subunit A [Plodia interpunctella]
MKTSKSPENKEVTPSKKKLTQARLPFKIISDASPTAATQQPRKRKLSAPNPEPVTKIGKISKENGITDDPVVISDDDCKVEKAQQHDDKLMNPFVKLVDTAWKKKQQKSKKKNIKKKKVTVTTNLESSECEEHMEVDIPFEISDTNQNKNSEHDIEEPPPTNHLPKPLEKSVEELEVSKPATEMSSPEPSNDAEVIVLEESNDADINLKTKEDTSDMTDKIHANMDGENCSKVLDNVKSDASTEEKYIEADDSKESQNKDIKLDVTPKRSSRNKANLNSSKLNDSVSSAPSTPKTPKTSRSSSVSNSIGNESLNDSTASLTPKQQQKKLESAKKKEEREKEKQEREKKRQQEKEERAKLKQEKEEQKKREREEKEEAKRKEKEEKEEQKRKEKEEKEKQKELEKKLREEKEDQKRKEKEEKEEQRRKEKEAREEEKRKKQEALELEKQEQEIKKKKAAEAFANFFVPKQKTEKEHAMLGPVSKNDMLSSFRVKVDMRLAPTVRTDLTEDKRENLDTLMKRQNEEMLYLKSLKEGISKPLSSGKTWPLEDKDDDVMVIEDELPVATATAGAGAEPRRRPGPRAKLLSFHHTRRPPYWGSWRRTSDTVTARRPFAQDQKHLDYSVDSDEEWEEEPDGESINGSAASDDDLEADEYEVDNDVFVPHGYLSDEEATMDEEDNVLALSPEAQKARLKHLEDEFESEMKKPTEKLKPRVYGLIWETSDGGKPENCVDALWNYFRKFSMIVGEPVLEPITEPEEAEKKKVKKKKSLPEGDSPKAEKKRKSKADNKEVKPKVESKKTTSDIKKNQPGINTFLTKVKSS